MRPEARPGRKVNSCEARDAPLKLWVLLSGQWSVTAGL